MDIILENIIRIMKEKEISQVAFCKEFNLPKSVFTDWKAGRNESYKKHILAIANFLQVNVLDLYGISYSQPEITLSNEERNVIELYRKITPQQQKAIIDVLIGMSLGV